MVFNPVKAIMLHPGDPFTGAPIQFNFLPSSLTARSPSACGDFAQPQDLSL
jgi:hypothetical protein